MSLQTINDIVEENLGNRKNKWQKDLRVSMLCVQQRWQLTKEKKKSVVTFEKGVLNME